MNQILEKHNNIIVNNYINLHKFTNCGKSVTERLAQLAPLHRDSAIRQAGKSVGIREIPTLQQIAIAENPEPAEWRLSHYTEKAPEPNKDNVRRRALELLASMGWREKQPSVSRRDLKLLAEHTARGGLDRAHCEPCKPIFTLANSEKYHADQATKGKFAGVVDQLRTLLDGLTGVIPHARLAGLSDDEVREEAEKRAKYARADYAERCQIYEITGLPAPVETPAELRAQDSHWHRRDIRRTAGLARQHLASALGTIGRGGANYADSYSLARRREQDESAKIWAVSRELVTPDGNRIPLSDVIQSAREGQGYRLGAISAGLDDYATENGLTPIRITITLPAVWHPNPTKGRKTWTPDRDPKTTDDTLRLLWGKFRARLAKSRIKIHGLRVWEPHRDAVPHLHALLYVQPEQIAEVDRHLLALCPDTGAKRVASELTVIDTKRCRGSTYISKYIRKTLNTKITQDETHDDDDDDHLTRDNFDRVRAVASERGWRRFAFLGVHGIQRIWQRLNSATAEEIGDAPDRVATAWAHLKAKNYSSALSTMGAFASRGVHRLKIGYATEESDDEGNRFPLLNSYGEPKKVAFCLFDSEYPREHPNHWYLKLSRGSEIVDKSTETKEQVTVSVSYPSEPAPQVHEEEEKTQQAPLVNKSVFFDNIRQAIRGYKYKQAPPNRSVDQLIAIENEENGQQEAELCGFI